MLEVALLVASFFIASVELMVMFFGSVEFTVVSFEFATHVVLAAIQPTDMIESSMV
jgi:hypothetical protein